MMAGRDDKRDEAPASADDGSFLGRWSRRKAEARTTGKTAAAAPDVLDPSDADDVLSAKDQADAPPAFDVDSLPDIDSLGPGSDFRVFMQAGVPPALKTKALRKLWRIKPELANLDGLLDYGEDLTGSFKVVDHLKTAYQVGRGFLRDDPKEAPPENEAADSDDTIAECDAPTLGPSAEVSAEIDAAEGGKLARPTGDDADKIERQKEPGRGDKSS